MSWCSFLQKLCWSLNEIQCAWWWCSYVVFSTNPYELIKFFLYLFSTILRRMLNKYPSRLTPKWFFVLLKLALFSKKDWICKNLVIQYLNGSCALDFFLAVWTKKRKSHQGEDITVLSTIWRQKIISLISEYNRDPTDNLYI
jgi:hypothetical protein